jgi:cytochrome c oxidase assembly protein subunit 11
MPMDQSEMHGRIVSTQNPQNPQLRRRPGRDLLVAFACGGFVAVMVGVSFAAVPLYSWFCRTTGFGGTTQVAKSAPTQVSGRTITVRFDSNVAPGLPWEFEPERRTIDVRLGEVVTVYYSVTNEAARVTTGQAGYNVTPPTVGIYFEKINCFCFTLQTLKPGEKRDMAVVFYVDPKLAKDSEQDTLANITLSYTFYPVRTPEPPVAESAPILPSPANGGG